MSFAENFPRNKRGWIQFGADADARKKLFPSDVMKHPAKNNLFELQAIIDLIYKPGELILDPMAGTGSIMIATLSDCRVVCIECSPIYADMLERSRTALFNIKPDADIMVLFGDCLDFLPLPVDHICFSPPFVDYLKKPTPDAMQLAGLGTTEEHLIGFSAGKGNVGAMPDFFHLQAMERVFKGCYESLEPSGTMTIISRDHTEAGKRIHLTRKYIRAAERAGFKVFETYKREIPRTGLDRYNVTQGITPVDDEDIVVFVK